MSSFKICVPDSSLALLKSKLELTRLPDELDEARWDYGAPLSDIRRLTSRWIDGYDWRKHEKALNDELPQFTREIEVEGHGTLNIHYVHQRSVANSAIPLLFIHGWPGSFIEIRKILPLLTQVKDDAPSFHVVGLGLAGFGFSEGTKKKGFGLEKHAEVGHKLMLALGYTEYVTQGGDWGCGIGHTMGTLYGGPYMKAFHTNTPFILNPPPGVDPSKYTDADREALKQRQSFEQRGQGYFQEQSTQPQSLGYSLADSPIGLLAWIYEKLVNWTDEYSWEDDEVLTWVSIYWFSRSGPAASIRIYYETSSGVGIYNRPKLSGLNIPIGYSIFPKEFGTVPKSWITEKNLVFEARHEGGGHFAAHERPLQLVEDLRKMFGKGGPAYNVVCGKDGYA